MITLKRHNVERKVTTEAAAERLVKQGFKRVNAESETTAPEAKSLDKMKIEELKALAEEKGIEGFESLTKKELVAVLKDVM